MYLYISISSLLDDISLLILVGNFCLQLIMVPLLTSLSLFYLNYLV